MNPFKEVHGGGKNTTVHYSQLQVDMNTEYNDMPPLVRRKDLYEDEKEIEQYKCDSKKDCLQDLPLNMFFELDLSNIVESDNNNADLSLPTIEAQDDNSSTSGNSTQSIVTTKDDIDYKNTQLFLNKDDDLGSYDYCLMVDIEVLSLVNSIENYKLEKDDFNFLDTIIELAMNNCATCHVCKDLSLLIGDIRADPNVRVKGVSGTSQAAGIGIIKF